MVARKQLADKLEQDARDLAGISAKGFERIIRHLNDAAFRLRYLQAQDVTTDLEQRVIQEADAAKQLMRKAGYGWTGLGLLETTRLVLEELSED